MPLTKQDVQQVLDVYLRAWAGQDPNLIVSIFTESATYHERVFEEPIRGRVGIYDYWKSKVVQAQANIECHLLSLYLEGDTAIAEWESEFDDLPGGVRKRMREVAILEFEGKQISGLREYWVIHRGSQPLTTNFNGIWLSRYEYVSTSREQTLSGNHYVILLQHGSRLTVR